MALNSQIMSEPRELSVRLRDFSSAGIVRLASGPSRFDSWLTFLTEVGSPNGISSSGQDYPDHFRLSYKGVQRHSCGPPFSN
jgi:hypothetical protein